MKPTTTLLAAVLAAMVTGASAQEITTEHQRRAKEIVSQMTLEEKIDYIGGDKGFYIRAVPRLGLPEVRMADGPQGVRNDTQSTMYPANIMTTATWNRDMAYAMGAGIGIDCKTRGVGIILGPGVNIYRSPLAGRCFEYTGEDPYLASESALGYILGVQDQGIMACVKHYAANNQEWDRNFASSDIDERTMQEIYLPTFRKAVMKGNVATVMNSYNLLNSVWATENQWLNIDVLRNQWGFKGILMSDWGAVHDAYAPVWGGLDLEMPSGAYMNRRNLMPAIQNGVIREKEIDQMCEHIVQTILAYQDIPSTTQQLPMDNPENCQRALDIAREGIVLLKNDRNALPLKGKTLVVGPNADVAVMGGGSGEVHPLHTVTTWQGLQTLFGKKVTLGETRDGYRHMPASCFTTPDGKQGFQIDLWDNQKGEGTKKTTMNVEMLNQQWTGSPCAGIPADHFYDVTTTRFTAPETATITFEVSGDDGYRMFFGDTEVAADWGNHGVTRRLVKLDAVKGETYDIRIEHFEDGGDAVIALDAKVWDESTLTDPAYLSQFSKADNIVVCVGWNQKLETEGGDHDFSLPSEQVELIRECANHGCNVIVVLNAGGNPNIAEWEQYAGAIVMAWYPGQEGGTAVAEVLAGKVNPSGKLPITIERNLADNPTSNSYYDKRKRLNEYEHRRVRYSEGIFMGYRGYDRNNVKPLYPFGYGLSYTTFEYSDINAVVTGNNEVTVSFNVKNTGKVDGKEVCEIYVTDPVCSVPRPQKELKGFEKVSLKKGETKRVTVKLDSEAFHYYDVDKHQFVVEPGQFIISVGGSSDNLPIKAEVTLQ